MCTWTCESLYHVYIVCNIILYHALYVCDIIVVQQHVRDVIESAFLSSVHSWFLVLKGLVYVQFQLFELRASTDIICTLYMHSV